eukprot:TRINITY_DN1368_c0_g2_i1.p1 TRINITY_DN1368_c0_g2~~TRINITY_DN1368_c0_g2_i1.p1  ORF type:complete len:413 (+),score=62.90 TRINITY_DN1368_c0_g2_i1:36-1274(+)
MPRLQTVLLMIASVVATQVAHGQTTCPDAPTVPEDRRVVKNRAVVSTYNAKWLFDGVKDRLAPWANTSEATDHMRSVAGALEAVGADVYIMEEVENCDVINEVKGFMPSGDLYKAYIIRGTDYYTGQNVALLTKIDPLTTLYRVSTRAVYPVPTGLCQSPSSDGDTGVSKHLVTRIELFPGMVVGFVGVHLLAWPTDKTRCSKREAQAEVVASIVKDLFNDTADPVDGIIVMGDFNDFSATLLDKSNDVPTSNVLETIKDSADPPLYEAAAVIPQDERVTEGTSMIDHILLSSSVSQYLTKVEIRSDLTASDHFPVVATLQLPTTLVPGATLAPTLQPTPLPTIVTNAPTTAPIGNTESPTMAPSSSSSAVPYWVWIVVGLGVLVMAAIVAGAVFCRKRVTVQENASDTQVV